MNEITKMYAKTLKESGLSYQEFVKTISNEEHKMYIQWKILKNHSK